MTVRPYDSAMTPVGRPSQAVLILPSTYGFFAWLGALAILSVSSDGYDYTAETWGIIVYTLALFGISAIIWLPHARATVGASRLHGSFGNEAVLFAASSVVGAIGLGLYVRDFSTFFGGTTAFFSTLLESSLSVRGAAQEVDSLGFQVSYFSWIAIYIGMFAAIDGSNKFWKRALFGGLAAVFFVMNLAFVDRTRPIWIFIVCVLSVMFSRGVDKIRPRSVALYAFIVPVGMFFLFSFVSGKYNAEQGITDDFVHYITGGFGYLDSLIAEPFSTGFSLERTLLPLAKALEALNIIGPVAPEVLDFRYVPFPTNVATFIEPIYSDGGIWFVAAFLPIFIISMDGLALSLFRTQTIIGRFLWANIIFTMLISFFVPKYNATAIYVFVAVFFGDQTWRLLRGQTETTGKPVTRASA